MVSLGAWANMGRSETRSESSKIGNLSRGLSRSFPRLAWITVVNAVTIYLLLIGSQTGGWSVPNTILILTLAVGIVLEWRGNIGCALFNIAPFSIVPLVSLGQRVEASPDSGGPGDFLMAVVIPSAIVGAINMFVYVPAVRRWWRNERDTGVGPDEEVVKSGAKYFCQIDRGCRGRRGRILDEQGLLRWHYEFRKVPWGRWRSNPFNKPDFVAQNVDRKAELVISRASFLPSVFDIRAEGRVVGRLRMTRPLHTRYAIAIDGVTSLVFRMPLYTAGFWGDSNTGTEVWAGQGAMRMEWNILIRPGINDHWLVPALSFIHNERWRYN